MGLDVEHGHEADDTIGLGEVLGAEHVWLVEEEAEVALVDADEGEAEAPVLADGAEHGAVSAEDEDAGGALGVFPFPVGFCEGGGAGVPWVCVDEEAGVLVLPAGAAGGDAAAVESVALDVGGDFLADFFGVGEAFEDEFADV